MESFTIQRNEYLTTQIDAWYHSEYHGGYANVPERIENMICTLKNDIYIKREDDSDLIDAQNRLRDILNTDLSAIKNIIDSDLTICVVPRAKVRYLPHQLLFKDTIKQVVNQLNLKDGTDYILRKTDTKTTHRARAGYGGSGPAPYIGITKNTCLISDDVQGKTILLIDDVYTPSVNIDEDAIQALLDKGATKVYFYAVGHTF